MKKKGIKKTLPVQNVTVMKVLQRNRSNCTTVLFPTKEQRVDLHLDEKEIKHQQTISTAIVYMDVIYLNTNLIKNLDPIPYKVN